MFEQGFSYLLSRFLGEFVQDGNFSKENVQVGIWSGYIVLENLVLKRKIVDSLELPVNLVHGMIGRLELKIPWANLGYEPVVVILDRVHIVVEPKYEWDADARKRREKNIKQAKLAGAELFATRRLVEGESENYTNMAQKWLLERLLSQLVDNLQVTIRDVHIRFEDHISCSKPFSAGVTFECLHAFSKDEEARQQQPPPKGADARPAPPKSGSYKKLIRMEQLSVYWNPVLSGSINPYYAQFIGKSATDIEVLMTRTVSRRSTLHADGPRHHYILHPVDFDVQLVVDREPTTSQPQPHVTVMIDHLKVSIEDRQFREYLILMSNFDSFQQIEKHSALRPQVTVAEDPRAWWEYAINVVVERNRAKRSTWSWVNLSQRSKDRIVYIELWKRKLVGHSRDGAGNESTLEELYEVSSQRRTEQNRTYPVLTPTTIAILEALEDKLTFEDIILFRSMAEKDLSESYKSQKSWLGGWASFLMGGWYGGVSEEEKRKLFEALRYDPDTILRAGQRAADPYAVLSKVLVRLNKGEVILGLSTPSTVESYNMAAMPFLQHNLHSLEVDVTVMGDGGHVKMKVQLQDFDCAEIVPVDGAVLGAAQYEYSEIASRRIAVATGTDTEATTPKRVARGAGGAPGQQSLPLLSIHIETQPPAEPYDTVVRAKLDEMKVVFAPSAKWLASLTTFVTWPEEIDYWMDLQMSAMNKLSDLNSQIEAKLEYMMQSHSAISLDVDLKAPILIVSPQPKIVPDSDVLVIDLGRVTMTTEQLARLEYLGQRGDMMSDTASTRHDDSFLLGPRVHQRGFSLHQNALEDELERLGNGILDPLSMDDRRSERSASIRGSRRLASRPGSVRRPLSSSWHRGGGDTNTVITAVDIDVQDQLFDKYQMHIHHMGVYVVKTVDQWLSLDFDNCPPDVCTSIMQRFDLTADLFVSALPWDSTLPPVKICAEMPELSIRLSEHKLVRLARILPTLVQSGMTALEASGEHLRKLESSQSKYRTADVTLMQGFDEVLHDVLQEDGQEEKNDLEPDAELQSNEDYAEFHDAHDPGLFDEQSFNLRTDLRRRMSAGTANESYRSFRSVRDRSVISDDSFESVVDFDEVIETAHSAEELKEAIRIHEAARVKLLGELRVVETQGNASALQDKHRQLKELDQELAELKANYVDVLMQLEANAHEIESLQEFQARQLDQSRNLNELLEGMHNPTEETLEELALKRNQFIASMLRPRLNLGNMKKTRKELVHVRINVQSLQLQLTQNETAPQAGAKSSRRESIVEFGSLIAFRVSGIGMRLRHSTAQTKVSFGVRDMDIDDAFQSQLIQKQCVIATSEPVYAALSSEYSSFLREGNADLVRVKLEVVYGQTYQQGVETITTADRYIVRATLNHLHLSLEQATLMHLVRAADSVIAALADGVSPGGSSPLAANGASSHKPEQAAVADSNGKFTFPSLTVTGRTGGFLLSLTIGHLPISTFALWGWSLTVKMQRHQLRCVAQMSDFVVYDHPSYRDEEQWAVSGSGADFAKMLSFGDGSRPMVEANVIVVLQPAGSDEPSRAAATVRTEAMQAMVTHTHVHKIVQWSKQRELLEQVVATSARFSELMAAVPVEPPAAPVMTVKDMYDECVTALLQWQFSAQLRAKSPIIYIPLSDSASLPRTRDASDPLFTRSGELPNTTAWPCIACALGSATAKLTCNVNGTSMLGDDGERYVGNHLRYSSDIVDARVWVYSGVEWDQLGGKTASKSTPTDCHAIPLVDDWNTYLRSSIILPVNAMNTELHEIQSDTHLILTPILLRLSNEACYTLGQVLLAQRWPDVGELEPLVQTMADASSTQQRKQPSRSTMFEGLPEIQCAGNVRLQGVGVLFCERSAPLKSTSPQGTFTVKQGQRDDMQHDTFAQATSNGAPGSNPARGETSLLAVIVSGIKLDVDAQIQSLLHNIGLASAPHCDVQRSAVVTMSLANFDLIDYRATNLPFRHLFAKHVSLDSDLTATPHPAAGAAAPFSSYSELSALAMTDPVIRVRAAFGQAGAQCQIHISNMHALVSAETLRCLYFVVRGCAESTMAALRPRVHDEHSKHQPGSPMQTHKKFPAAAKGFGDKGGSNNAASSKEQHHREVIHPRPTSSPMAPSYSFLPSQSNPAAAPTNSESERERRLLFSPTACTLPPWLRAIQVTVTLSSSGLWIPSDDHDADAPALLSLASVQADFTLSQLENGSTGGDNGAGNVELNAHVIVADLRLGFVKPRLPGFLLDPGNEPFFDSQARADDDTVVSMVPSMNGSIGGASYRTPRDVQFDARTLPSIGEQSEDSLSLIALDYAQYFEIPASNRATQLGTYSAILFPTTIKVAASVQLHPMLRTSHANAHGAEERKSHEPPVAVPGPVRPIMCSVNVDVRDVEAMLYVDYRPFQWIVERTLMPLAELAGLSSGTPSTGGTTATATATTTAPAAASMSVPGARPPLHQERLYMGENPTSTLRIATWQDVFDNMADLVQLDCGVDLGTFKLYLVNNVYQQPSAILQLRLTEAALRVVIPTVEDRLSLTVAMRAEADYYNVSVMAWEPLIEPFHTQAEVQAPVGTKVSCLVESGDGAQSGVVELHDNPVRSEMRAELEIMLVVTNVINVNFTLAFIEILANTLRLVSELGSVSPDGMKDEHDLSITWLRNDTGVHLQYWTTDPNHTQDVRAHSQAPLLSEAQIGNPDYIINSTQRSRLVSLSLQRPGASPWKPIRDVPCESTTSRIFWLEHSQRAADSAVHDVSANASGSRASRKLEQESRLDDGVLVPVVCETTTHHGVKTLVLRSTMRLQNTTNLPFRVRLLSASTSRPLRKEGRHRSGWDVLWETVLPVNGVLPVPIHLCASTNMYFELSPLSTTHDMSTAIVPVPSFTPHDRKIMKGQGRGPSGSARRRKDKLVDLSTPFSQPADRLPGRGEEYAHWLSFMPMTAHQSLADGVDLTHLTVAASIRGAPRSRQTSSQAEPGSTWLRTVTLCAPLAVSNLLSERIECRLCVRADDEADFDWSVKEWIDSGDEWQWFGCHPSEPVYIALRLPNMEWSEPVLLQGCDDSERDPSVQVAELPSLNGAILPIHLEVADVLGRRKVHMYAPYWIISLSTLPLQFQHDPSSLANKDLNGKDGVAAHQHYDTFLVEKMSQLRDVESPTAPLGQLWRSRGQDGVILGPAEPIRGFPDLVPRPSHGGVAGVASEGVSRTSLLAGDRDSARSMNPALRRSSLLSQVSDFSVADSLGLTSRYNVSMAGYTQSESETTKLRFRIEGASWSSPVSLSSSAGAHKHLQLVSKTTEERSDPDEPIRAISTSVFPCGVSFHAAPAPFQRTKLVTIVDQFMVVNNVGRVIELRHGGQHRQQDQIHVMVLNANEAKPIFWSSTGSTQQKQFQVRLQEYGWEWSGKFKIDDHEQTEIPLRLRNEHNSTVFLMTIDVIRFESRVVISLRARPFETAPYRIENHTLETVRLHQAGVDNVGLTLLPYHSCGYAWDEPLGKHELVVDKIAPGSAPGTRTWVQDGTFSFEQLRAYETESHIMVRVTAEGPTRVMQLVDRRSGWDEVLRPMLEQAEDEDVIDGDASAFGPAPLQVTIAVGGIGVSLIDGQPQELIYASIADLILEYIHNAADEVYTRCMVRRIQVDSQIWSTPFPTLFYPLEEAFEYNRQRTAPVNSHTLSIATVPQQLDLTSARSITWKPFLTIEAIRGFRYPGVHFLRLLSLDVQPFDVSVEGTIIMAMSRMALQAMDLLNVPQSGQLEASTTGPADATNLHDLGRVMDDVRTPTDGAYAVDADFADDEEDIFYEIRPIPFVADLMKRYDPKVIQEVLAIRGRRLYLERLVLSDIRLNVSFNPSVRQVDPELLSLAESSALVKFILGPGAALASILNCPLRFRGLELKHLFVDEQALGVRLATHYTTQALGQAYLLLGSSEALGNPARLMSLLGQGMWDFIREPVVGLFTSPQAFGVGVVRGTSSLLTRTIASLSDSASHVSSWLASTIVAFGIADTHRISPTTSTVTVIRPRGAISGLSQGIIGLFSEPIYGLRTAGARGAVKGLVLGALGVLAKPTFGILDTASKMFSTLSFRVLPQIALDQKFKMRRVRPPRYFRSPLMPLQVFRPEENAGEELLSRVQNGQYRSEGYVWHAQLTNVIVILTPKRLLVVGDQQDYCVVYWQTTFDRIVLLETSSQQHDVSSPLSVGSYVVDRPGPTAEFEVQLYHLPDTPAHSSQQAAWRTSMDKPRLSPRRAAAKSGLDTLGMRLIRRALRFENSEQEGTFISYILQYQPSLRTEELMEALENLSFASHTPRSVRSASGVSSSDAPEPWQLRHALITDRLEDLDSQAAEDYDDFDSTSLPS